VSWVGGAEWFGGRVAAAAAMMRLLVRQQHPRDLRRAGELLIPAIAYGDAAGEPFEGEPAGAAVNSLTAGCDPVFGAHPAGVWSDDTQLSIAMAQGLIHAGRFDLDAIAHEHVIQFLATPAVVVGDGVAVRGWGPLHGCRVAGQVASHRRCK
jgi:ADP-ribosylglycohydrolase